MRRIIHQFWPIFFIFFIWFIFASPYFLKNEVPYPSNYQVNFVPPWSYYENFWGPVKNSAMPDIIGQLYPWRYFSINMWKTGEIPFWNPYSFSGNPHIANYQSAAFSPLNFLFFIFPFIDGWSISVLLQPFLAGLFTYFLLKEFKVSNVGSIISSITFMFCGFIVVWMAYGTMSLAISFLPLSILALEKNFKKISFVWLLILILSIPLSFFSGHFQTSLYFLILTVIFYIFKIIQTKDLKKSILVFFSIVLGLIISSVQILPAIEFYLYSVRSSIFINKGEGMPFRYLITIFSPDFFGNPVTRNDWFGYYAEWSSFIGIIPVILSIFSLIKKRAISVFFLATGILSLLLAVNSPFSDLIGFLKIPVISTSNPTRIIVLFSFSFAVLAGFGLDNLKTLISKKKDKKVFFPFFAMGILLALIWILLLTGKVMPIDKLLIAKRNLILPTILFGGALVVALTALRFKFFLFFVICFLLFAVSFDSLRFAQKWMPFDPEELVFVNIPIINAIKKNIGNGRYFGNLGDQVDSYYGFQSIEGYDPLYIGRYGEFIRSISTGKFLQAERSLVRLDRRGKYTDRALDLLGVSLIFHPIADTNQGWAYPVWEEKEKYAIVYQDNKFQLFKNNTAMGRAVLFYNYQVIPDSKKLLERFYQDNFDFRNTLLLEKNINLVNINDRKGNGSAKILSYTPNKIVIKVQSNREALLFLSDNFYPGWEARVSSKKTEILRADYAFRAVAVPKGDSKVEFKYSPFSLF